MTFKDRNQNFWQLACISGTALGLPGMVIGGQLAQKYGAYTALISVLIGNLILWITGLGIISMANQREQAIENIKGYLGKTASIIAAFVWVCAFLIWFAIQIKNASIAISPLFPNQLATGCYLGLIATIFGIGGIKLIKHVCCFCLPVLIFYCFYGIFNSERSVYFDANAQLSIPAILLVIAVWLPGTVNLPTFFRHSKSKASSVLALNLVTLFHMFFEISTILMNIQSPLDFIASQTGAHAVLAVGFVLTSYFLSNLLNIYYASAGWETIFSLKSKPVEYFFVGILGTCAYQFFKHLPGGKNVIFSMEFGETILSNFIACLGVVLVISFLIRLVVKHRPKPFEKLWSSLSWGIGCVASLLTQIQATGFEASSALTVGISSSALSFLFIMFIEESVWAFRHVQEALKKDQTV